MRPFRYRVLRRLHLWLALPLALFLIILGLTGSAIAWMHELDVLLNPQLLQVTENNKNPRLSTTTLLARLNASPGYENPYMLELPQKFNDVLIARYKTEKSDVIRQVMMNPYTGVILGERNWGESGLSRPLLMPTLFHLHRQLLLGETGRVITSVNAILLTVIALTGIYLWWPVWRLKAWWQAITISPYLSWKHFNFRLHRAAGFYAAPVFLMLAITGIYFNKPNWITPFGAQKPVAPLSQQTAGQPLRPLDDILHIAQQQFPTAQITRISFPKKSNTFYEIRLHQPSELRQHTGATRVSIDSVGGTVVKIQDPLKARQWDWLVSYFFPLHSGEIFGVAGKIAMSLFGLVPLLLAISGTVIWLRRK